VGAILGVGGGDAVGSAIARGADSAGRGIGVSDGAGEAVFFGDFAGVPLCFFFPCVGVPFGELFFFFTDLDFLTVGSGVSLGVAFGFGFGDGDLDLWCGLGVGVGDSSGSTDAADLVLRNSCRFSSSVSCA